MFESSWKAKSDNNSHQFDNLFKEWGLACHIIKEQQEPFTTNLPWIGHIGRANGASTLMYCSPSTQRGIIIYINGMKKETNGNMGFAPVENEIIKVIVNRHWRK